MITMDEIERLLFSGGDVVGDDGKKIGGIGEVFLDATSGQPAWVTVKTGLFGTSESFVPLTGADVRGDEIHVPFGKDTVKHAPRMETAGGHLSPDEERDLYRYYGLVDDEPEPRDLDRSADTASLADAGHGRHVQGDATPDVPVPVAVPTGTDATSHGAHAVGDDVRDRDDRDRDDRYRDHDLDDDTRRDLREHETADRTPVPDDGSMVRSEERLKVVGTERVPTERVRMRRYTVTENREVTVPVTREEFRLEYEPNEPGATSEILDADTVGTKRGETAVEPHVPSHGADPDRH